MVNEKPNWKGAEEKLRYLEDTLSLLDSAIKKKEIKWAKKDLKILIASAGVIGGKLGFEKIIDKGKDLFQEWWILFDSKRRGLIQKKFVKTKELYKLWARSYEKTQNPMIDLEKGRLIPMFKRIKGKRLLDLGCGTGRNTIPLAKKGAIISGIDFSQEMLNEAKNNAKKAKVRIDFQKRDVTKRLPYSSESFDFILVDLVFNHIKNINQLVKEIARVMKPNGVCIASTVHPYLSDPDKWGTIPFVSPLGLWLTERYEHPFNVYIDAFNKAKLKWKMEEYSYTIKEIKAAKRKHQRLRPKRPFLMILKITKN